MIFKSANVLFLIIFVLAASFNSIFAPKLYAKEVVSPKIDRYRQAATRESSATQNCARKLYKRYTYAYKLHTAKIKSTPKNMSIYEEKFLSKDKAFSTYLNALYLQANAAKTAQEKLAIYKPILPLISSYMRHDMQCYKRVKQ